MDRELSRSECGLAIVVIFVILQLPYIIFLPGFLFLAVPLIMLAIFIVLIQAVGRGRNVQN
jgi:hypothetical protein